MNHMIDVSKLRSQISDQEWQLRLELAATYRLIALYGWDDLIYTHVSLRIPGPEHHFLINPYGMMFDEITASSLVKINLDGKAVIDTPYEVNPAGFTIHSAIHSARDDAQCVLEKTIDGRLIMPFLTDRIEENKRKMVEGERLAHEEARHSDSADLLVNPIYQNRYSFTPEEVRGELEKTIFGQKNTINLLVDIMKVTCVGLSDPRKPLASILFTGPTGVGKTESVRSVARAVHGTSEALCRIDMNTLSQEHYAASFSGSPPGHVGSKEGMTLLDQEKIEGSSSLPGIVLFDELEKASNEVVLALMNVLDNGILTVASGERTISFRNSIIFMTSNIAIAKGAFGNIPPVSLAFWRWFIVFLILHSSFFTTVIIVKSNLYLFFFLFSNFTVQKTFKCYS